MIAVLIFLQSIFGFVYGLFLVGMLADVKSRKELKVKHLLWAILMPVSILTMVLVYTMIFTAGGIFVVFIKIFDITPLKRFLNKPLFKQRVQ